MAKHNDIGRQGEDKAASYLIEKGYTILERNWRFRHLEVDIICRIADLLVIVEVKTRLSEEDNPEDLLSWQKRKNLLRAADAYVKIERLNMELRFDLIIVSGKEMVIKHIPEAINILD